MSPASLSAALRRLPPENVRYLWLAGFIGLVIIASLKIGEHYPFSNFPMYGNPNASAVDYYFLTNASGDPLPTGQLTGDTAPKIKKRLNTNLREWIAANPKLGKANMPEDVRNSIACGVLNDFVEQAKRRGTPLPDHIQLWRGDIHSSPDGYYETFAMEAAN